MARGVSKHQTVHILWVNIRFMDFNDIFVQRSKFIGLVFREYSPVEYWNIDVYEVDWEN